jgi:hypothetical protein
MDIKFNPFNELYVGETVSSSEFVELFSPSLLPVTGALFLPGNVVLKGVQGSGKSMLLHLLRPDVRIAYERRGIEFPLAGRYARFIGAGINLTTSNAIAFGQRSLKDWGGDQAVPLYFGDFINYWIVLDLLQAIEALRDGLSRASVRSINLRADSSLLDRFAQRLATAKCWFGFLDGTSSYSDLKSRFERRLNDYLAFINFNIDDIPERTQRTKTLIGEPISQTAELLRSVGIIPEDVHVFVRIDQFEELFRLEGLHKQYGPVYRSVIFKALGLRNPHVSYRLGTRGSAWDDRSPMFGTASRLERDRNYKLIDLDEMLRRQENARTWIFPKFAEDVFQRRLRLARQTPEPGTVRLVRVFDDGPTVEQRAQTYCKNARPESIVKSDDDWPDEWKKFLLQLAASDPVSARLGEAWARQKDKRDIVNRVPAPPYPWDTKKYWRKERLQLALMQIAARCSQRITWAGRNDILELSGGNILVFVSLCQHIWGAWLRTEPEISQLPKISYAVQAVGIQETSTLWYEKILEEAGGNTRQRFVAFLATAMQKQLHDDSALSYPGHNGFSLSVDDYTSDERVFTFLRDCVMYGVLFDFPHTTKLKDRKPRRKWYLNPIYSPHFRLPHVHTKEPMYLRVEDVHRWIDEAYLHVVEPSLAASFRTTTGQSEQRGLFDTKVERS